MNESRGPLDAAPLFQDVADAPEGGQCHWLRADDGLRLRIAHWPVGERGTVLLFPGRTEYIEKYGRAAAEFAARGFAMLTVDWRGQGLADRVAADPLSGHVGRFTDYQHDVRAMLGAARAMGLPEPYFLLAHSMGGGIGLRALYEKLPVRAAVFTAPMWGIVIAPALRPLAWAASWASRSMHFDQRYTPGTNGAPYVETADFDDNMLTRDPDMWQYMRAQLTAHPELRLGGPSLGWLYEALRETRALRGREAPRIPALTVVGTDERIVDRTRISERMADWPGGTLDVVAGARHEIMMERPDVRHRFFDDTAALFTRHA